MKLEVSPEGKTVVDDHEDNFAIVFAAMGVSKFSVLPDMTATVCLVVE